MILCWWGSWGRPQMKFLGEYYLPNTYVLSIVLAHVLYITLQTFFLLYGSFCDGISIYFEEGGVVSGNSESSTRNNKRAISACFLNNNRQIPPPQLSEHIDSKPNPPANLSDKTK